MPSFSSHQGDLSSSPASSITSGSTRSHKISLASDSSKKSQTNLHLIGKIDAVGNNNGWNPFKKSSHRDHQMIKNDNIIFR